MIVNRVFVVNDLHQNQPNTKEGCLCIDEHLQSTLLVQPPSTSRTSVTVSQAPGVFELVAGREITKKKIIIIIKLVLIRSR
jgi:hypothetical protein